MINDMPDGLARDIFKVFEKYDIKDSRVIICMWKRNQLSCAMRSIAQKRELIERVKDWLVG
jgi:hypothetical protein